MPKRLTVFCPLGLSNRLRVLLSGFCLARASGRQFKMLWPLTDACAAPFETLFSGNWPVETVNAQAVKPLPYIPGWFGSLPNLLTCETDEVVVGHPGWLLRPEKFPEHNKLLEECAALLRELKPAPEIQQRAELFRRQHFRPNMIGVHLRRGDFLRERPDTASNTSAALEAVDNFLSAMPAAGILLCTDDGAPRPGQQRPTRREGLQRLFANRYGEKVAIFENHHHNRKQAQAARDALLEFHLLRETDAFVGTRGSSFSEMIAFGQNKPHLLTSGASSGYRLFETAARATMLYAILQTLGRRATGQDLPFPVLWQHYSRMPFRWLRGLLQKTHRRTTR